MSKRLLITGGGGFCGSHLAEHLAERFHVTLFDNFERDSLRFAPRLQQDPNITVITGDVLDREALGAAIEGVDTVIHCAAIAGVSKYYERPVDTLRVNILGTFNLLDASVAAGVRRFIYFSTSEIYGTIAENVRETAPPTSGPVSERRWVYGVSKLAGEHCVLRFGETYGIKTCAVRPFNVYGPRQTGEGAISNFVTRLVRGESIEIYGDGADVRAWCHVRDLVSAVDLILDNDAAYGQSFNIGNPDARLTTLQLAERLIALHGGGEMRWMTVNHEPIRIRVPNIDLARSLLGYEPTIGIDAGLADTLSWFEQYLP